jgi:hypothetical protein
MNFRFDGLTWFDRLTQLAQFFIFFISSFNIDLIEN